MRVTVSPSSRAIYATVSPVVSRSRIRSLRSAAARRRATRRAGSGAGASRARRFMEGLVIGGFQERSRKNLNMSYDFQKEKCGNLKTPMSRRIGAETAIPQHSHTGSCGGGGPIARQKTGVLPNALWGWMRRSRRDGALW